MPYYVDKRTTTQRSYPFTAKGQAAALKSGKLVPHRPETQETFSYRTQAKDANSKQISFRERERAGHLYGYSESVDTGHDFWTEKREAFLSHFETYVANQPKGVTPTRWYRGPMFGYYSNNKQIQVGPVPDWDFAYWGNRFIADSAPTAPHFSLATFAGELREGLPKIIGSQLMFRDRADWFRNLGSEYLNVEFGWKPFLGEFTKMLQAVVMSSFILEQYDRDSGRQVRRWRDLPPITNTSVENFSTTTVHGYLRDSQWDSLYSNVYGKTDCYVSTTETHSFSGAFTYYLAHGSEAMDKIRYYAAQANHLLGLAVTPEVLWELAPWSWLADWKFNFGDIIANASRLSTDGLVMLYGYVQRDIHVVRTYNTTGITFKHKPEGYDGLFAESTRVHRKERKRGEPYGFSAVPVQLNAQQTAILAALFASRGQGGSGSTFNSVFR